MMAGTAAEPTKTVIENQVGAGAPSGGGGEFIMPGFHLIASSVPPTTEAVVRMAQPQEIHALPNARVATACKIQNTPTVSTPRGIRAMIRKKFHDPSSPMRIAHTPATTAASASGRPNAKTKRWSCSSIGLILLNDAMVPTSR